MFTRTLIVLATLTALTACSSLREPGSPKQSFSIQEDIIQLQAAAPFHVTLEDYYCIQVSNELTLLPCPPDSNVANSEIAAVKQKKHRDKFIAFRLVTINLHYVEFVKEVAVNKAQLDTALDVLNLGLTLASTVVGSQATAAILSAAAAGVAGTRISYDKNFFYEKTVEVLVTAMNAQRMVALIPIERGLAKSIDDYPFERAITDLHIYFASGTFNGALQAIQKDAGQKEVEAEIELKQIRDVAFFSEEAQKDVDDQTDMIGLLTDEAALDLLRNPPVKFEAFVNSAIAGSLGGKSPGTLESGKKARAVLKMVNTLISREKRVREPWNAAIAAADKMPQQP